MTQNHPEIADEQAHVDRAYRRLEEMRNRAVGTLTAALAQAGGGATHQALLERDVMVAHSSARLARLEIGDEPLCFGRIDRTSGETFHIGRLAVADVNHEPLVIDWR
ncbi:MAG: hypothetical protein C4344_00545, partial [Acidimicrobiia bacterium]